MKNACIVIRDNRNYFSGTEFEKIVAALLDGGYASEKIYLLSAEEEQEFAQTFLECKNFFENVFIVSPSSALPEIRAKVCELLKIEKTDTDVVHVGQKSFFFFKSGRAGEDIAREETVPYLDAKYGVRHGKVVLRAFGVPEQTQKKLRENTVAAGKGAFVCTVSENDGDFRFEILYDDKTSKMLVDEATRKAAKSLQEYLYAVEDIPLNVLVVELLKLRGLKLSMAESFTGGGVAQKIVEVSGASAVLFESVVAYDNGSKRKRLGVSRQTLDTQGAVSDETAYEMATGLLSTGDCSVALATTGIAGPNSDGSRKPVGLCYIAVGTQESVYVYKYILKGDRQAITRRAINQALFLLYKQIK